MSSIEVYVSRKFMEQRQQRYRSVGTKKKKKKKIGSTDVQL